MNTAIVYDRVNKWGGAERVLLALHEIFPDAPLYTAVYDNEKAPWAKIFPKVIPSFLNKIPYTKNNHELLGFLTPLAFESFNFDNYDLVISVTSEAAKGIITKPQTLHICYCLTPTRYLWSGYEEYLNNPPTKLSWIPFYKWIAKPILSYVRNWDQIASQRPDKYVAISHAVQERIKKYYKRESEVIYPPVDIERFKVSVKTEIQKQPREEFYLFVSRLIPYKKADIAIKAFNKLGKKLIVSGKGSELRRLKKIVNDNVEIKYIEDRELPRYFANAKALIFPGEEDFGIVMVESLAAGTPVIAFGKGGSLDIVEDGKTGILFNKQSVKSLIKAIDKFEGMNFDSEILTKSVESFSKMNFQNTFKRKVEKCMRN